MNSCRLVLFASIVAAAAIACSSGDRGADSSTVAGGSTAVACVEGGAPPTITSAGVGPLRIGAPVREVAERCTVRDTSFTLGEGIVEQGRVVDLDGSPAVVMLSPDAEPTIARVIVNDPAVRTEAGVGVGKTVGALRAAYGRLCAAMGEGRVVVFVQPLAGVSFGVSTRPSSLPGSGANIDRTPEAIPDSSTITSIWVHGGRTTCGGS
jgi:hypothetical protein